LVADCCDRLHQLVVVAQDRDAHERARDISVAERVAHDFPRGDEVCSARGSDENAGADHILDRGAGLAFRRRSNPHPLSMSAEA
jgi:hypothetical protein